MFGFSLSGLDGKSFVDIGVLWSSSMRDKNELVWIEAISDKWWTNYVEGIRFQSHYSENIESFSVNKELATTDTGTSCTFIPGKYYSVITDKILADGKGYEWNETYGQYIMPCDNKLPRIDLLLGGYWL